jgi:hypothetical protein
MADTACPFRAALVYWRREWQSEPAAIERAAAATRGSRVVAFRKGFLNPTAAAGGGVSYFPDRPAVLTRKRNNHA